jgi:hypothetical protein
MSQLWTAQLNPLQIRDTTFRDTLSGALKIHDTENLSYNDQGHIDQGHIDQGHFDQGHIDQGQLV